MSGHGSPCVGAALKLCNGDKFRHNLKVRVVRRNPSRGHMSDIVGSEKTRQEKVYSAVTLLVGTLLWVLIAFSAVMNLANPALHNMIVGYLTYGVLIALGIWISSAAYRATAFGNMILLGPEQLPALHEMVLDGSRALGLTPPPKAFLYNSNGLLNAFARRLLGGRYVFLTSALVDAESDAQIRFVIGHELGHHAAGHLNPWLNFLRLPTFVVPFLHPAYSRAREYTCDRIGARLTDAEAVSQRALLMLGCGCARVNASLNCEAFVSQEKMVPPAFGFLTEIFRNHPRLTRRLAAVKGVGPKPAADLAPDGR